MKRFLSLCTILPLFLLGFVACKKCADCTCASTYEFGPAVTTAQQDSIKADWVADHPDLNEEICGSKKNYESDTEEFETGDDNGNIGDFDNSQGFSYFMKYSCNCAEQD